MSVERWADIPGFEGLYQVSDKGRVRSVTRKVLRKTDGAEISVRGRILSLLLDDRFGGRRKAGLRKDGQQRQYYVASLVALAFLGPRPEGQYVCHNDGNALNDCLENLRYDTPWGNSQDRHIHGTTLRGEQINTARLTAPQVVEVRSLAAAGLGPRAIGRRFGMHEATIRAVIARKTWRHIA